jgi:hypothetical protein
MIGYIVVLIIIVIIVSIITEQMLIRRLRLEEGVMISKGKCVLKPGYGLLPQTNSPTQPANSFEAKYISPHSSMTRQNGQSDLMNFYRPLKG